MFKSYFAKEDNPLTQPSPPLCPQTTEYYSAKLVSDSSLFTASCQLIQNTAVKLLGHVKLRNKLQTGKAGKLVFFFRMYWWTKPGSRQDLWVLQLWKTCWPAALYSVDQQLKHTYQAKYVCTNKPLNMQ